MRYTAAAAADGVLHRVECAPGLGDSGRTLFDGALCPACGGVGQGEGVTCATCGGDGKAWKAWPAYGMHVRLAANGPWVVAVAKGHAGPLAGGKLVVGNQQGTTKVVSDVSGDFAVGIEPLDDGFRIACVLPGQMTWKAWRVSGDLETVNEEPPLGTVPASIPGTSQGWTEFKNRVPTWKDEVPNVVLGGVLFSEPSRDGRWTVGLSNRDFGVDAYDHELNKVVRVWSGNTGVRPSLASLPNGQSLVAICADSAVFVPSSAFDAEWKPKPVVVTYPAFEPTTYPVFVRVMDEPEMPGAPADPLIWGTVDRDPIDAIQASVRAAESMGLYFFGYNDDPVALPDPKKIPEGHFALVRSYADAGEMPEAFEKRLRAHVKAVKGCRVALMLRGFMGVKGDGTYHRTVDQVRHGFRSAWKLCTEGLVEGIVVFNYDKSMRERDAQGKLLRFIPDGVGMFPELWKDVQDMRAASGNWRAFPIRPTLEDADMIVVPASKVKPYWEWPTSHVVILGDDNRVFAVNATGAGYRWVMGENRGITPSAPLKDGHSPILSGESWQRLDPTTLIKEHNGVVYKVKVDLTR